MQEWLKARWRSYLESVDPDELMAGSGPSAIAVGPGTLVVLFLALAYVPPLARLSQFRSVWEAVALVAAGMVLTLTAWRHECRGTVGSLATLFDNTFYSAALALAAMSTAPEVGLALAVVHGLMLVAFPAQFYAFSLLFAVSLCLPVVALLVVLQPSLAIGIVNVCSLILMLAFTEMTRNRRLAAQRQLRLEQALGAADRLADESVQAALTTTLLTLGHFLHELRNYQTAISLSLEYVAAKGTWNESTAAALEEAQLAQRRQEALLNDMVTDLRGRSRPADGSFMLGQVVQDSIATTRIIDVVVNKPDGEFEVAGNPEHLRIVFLNLLRNAEQAGARTVGVVWRPDSSGQAAQMIVHDDGKGIPEAQRADLFATFAISDKPGGSGLGLYLVRRYIEVLGGQVRVEAGPMGGAAFVLRVPGKIVETPPV